jgi:hypothetical protein
MKKFFLSLSLVFVLFHLLIAVDSNTLDCIKKIMDRGYGTNMARDACYGFGQVEMNCLFYLLDAGYGPSTGRQNCEGVSNTEFECIKEILSRGYGINTARENCKD